MNQNPVIIVSGGSHGLGKGMVEELSSHNYRIATFSKHETPFIAEKRAADPQGNSFFWLPVDPTNHEALTNFVTTVHQHYGRIDGLVNNSSDLEDFLTASKEINHAVLKNLQSVIQLTRLVTRVMRNQSSGCLINMSSVVGMGNAKNASIFNKNKSAIDGLTRSLAKELGSCGIRVNSISPGMINSDALPQNDKETCLKSTPLGRMGRIDDIAGVVRFLLSPQANFITGQALVIDGGLSC